MAKWDEMTTEELCDQIVAQIGTTVYSSAIREFSISGETFFSMEKDDWSLFFATMGMKTFSHMMKLKKWVAECNEMAFGPSTLPMPPTKRPSLSSFLLAHQILLQELTLIV
jgi:hypothetical protein